MFDWLLDRVADAQGTAAAREHGWTFVLNPPATEDDLQKCENVLGASLPPGYRAFLRRWNGASLFRLEHRWPNGQVTVSAEFGI